MRPVRVIPVEGDRLADRGAEDVEVRDAGILPRPRANDVQREQPGIRGDDKSRRRARPVALARERSVDAANANHRGHERPGLRMPQSAVRDAVDCEKSEVRPRLCRRRGSPDERMRSGAEVDGSPAYSLWTQRYDLGDLQVNGRRAAEAEMKRRAVADAVAIRGDRCQEAVVPGERQSAVRQEDARQCRSSSLRRRGGEGNEEDGEREEDAPERVLR